MDGLFDYFYLFDGKINDKIGANSKDILDEFKRLNIATSIIESNLYITTFNEHAISTYINNNEIIITNTGLGVGLIHNIINLTAAPLVYKFDEKKDLHTLVKNAISFTSDIDSIIGNCGLRDALVRCNTEEEKSICRSAFTRVKEGMIGLYYACIIKEHTDGNLVEIYNDIILNKYKADVKPANDKAKPIMDELKSIDEIKHKMKHFAIKEIDESIFINLQQSGSCSFYSIFNLHIYLQYRYSKDSFVHDFVKTYRIVFEDFKNLDIIYFDWLYSKSYVDKLAEEELGLPPKKIEAYRKPGSPKYTELQGDDPIICNNNYALVYNAYDEVARSIRDNPLVEIDFVKFMNKVKLLPSGYSEIAIEIDIINLYMLKKLYCKSINTKTKYLTYRPAYNIYIDKKTDNNERDQVIEYVFTRSEIENVYLSATKGDLNHCIQALNLKCGKDIDVVRSSYIKSNQFNNNKFSSSMAYQEAEISSNVDLINELRHNTIAHLSIADSIWVEQDIYSDLNHILEGYQFIYRPYQTIYRPSILITDVCSSPLELINILKVNNKWNDSKFIVEYLTDDVDYPKYGFTFMGNKKYLKNGISYTKISIYQPDRLLLYGINLEKLGYVYLAHNGITIIITPFDFMLSLYPDKTTICFGGDEYILIPLKEEIREFMPAFAPYLHYEINGVGYIKVIMTDTIEDRYRLDPTPGKEVFDIFSCEIAPSGILPLSSSFNKDKFVLMRDLYQGLKYKKYHDKLLDSYQLNINIDLSALIQESEMSISYTGVKSEQLGIEICDGFKKIALSNVSKPDNIGIIEMMRIIITRSVSEINNAADCWTVKDAIKKLKNINDFIIPAIKEGKFYMFEVLFMMQNNYFINEYQYKKYKEILNSREEKTLKVHQFMMGKGKTSVITPLLAIALGCRGIKSNIITLDHLKDQTKLTLGVMELICGFKINVYSDSEAKLMWLKETDRTLKEEVNFITKVNIIDEFDSMYDYNRSTFNYVVSLDYCFTRAHHKTIFNYVASKLNNVAFNEKTIELQFLENSYNISQALVYNSSFGFVNDSLLCIPYLRKDTPLIGSNFSSLLITLMTTFRHLYYNLRDHLDLFYLNFKSHNTLRGKIIEDMYDIYDSEIPREEKISRLRDLINGEYINTHLEEFLYCANVNKIKIAEKHYNLSFQDLLLNTHNQWQVGYTGTTNIIMNKEIGTIIPDPDYIAEINLALSAFGSNKELEIIKTKDLTTILNLVDRGIVDLCGLFLKFDNKEIADKINLHYEGSKNVIYFNKYHKPNLSEVNNNNFYYYDQCHTVGTDVSQPRSGKFAILIDKKTRLTDFSQAIFRFRNLNRGTYMCVVIVDDYSGDLLDLLNSNETKYNEAQIAGINLQLTKAKLRSKSKNYLETGLKPNFLFAAGEYPKYFISGLKNDIPGLLDVIDANTIMRLSDSAIEMSVSVDVNVNVDVIVSKSNNRDDSDSEIGPYVIFHKDCDACMAYGYCEPFEGIRISYNVIDASSLILIKYNGEILIDSYDVANYYCEFLPIYNVKGKPMNYKINRIPLDMSPLIKTIFGSRNPTQFNISSLDECQKTLLFHVLRISEVSLYDIVPSKKLIVKVPTKHKSKTVNYKSNEYGKVVEDVEPIYNYFTYWDNEYEFGDYIKYIPTDVKTGGSISTSYFIIIVLLLLFILYLSWSRQSNKSKNTDIKIQQR